MTTIPSELRARLSAAGQDHVFAFWEELDTAARANLTAELDALDLDLIGELAKLQRAGVSERVHAGDPEPPELFPLERDAGLEARAREAQALGRELLATGRVGFVLVAGGQASRLGYDGPKGAFPVGPVSKKTLFELHARRLHAAARRHGCRTPWYVMTSQANDAATKQFFEEREYFGLASEDVVFFTQDMIPALDDEGRILMARKDALFLAPNGHGGVLGALATSGALDDMRARNVDLISYFQVDNPLVRPADPLFLGLHAQSGAGMSSKVVEKTDPDEKVGVVGSLGGELGIVEYSDLSPELRNARDDSGKLRFRAGNIAVHVLGREFVGEITRDGLQLPWHLAHKRMTVIGPDGATTEVAGTKFETFVFDALARSSQSVTLEVSRAHEFSPVKNAEGSDSPATAHADLCRLFAGWARTAGLDLPSTTSAEEPVAVEVDPLIAEDEEEFLAAHRAGPLSPAVVAGGHLYDRA